MYVGPYHIATQLSLASQCGHRFPLSRACAHPKRQVQSSVGEFLRSHPSRSEGHIVSV